MTQTRSAIFEEDIQSVTWELRQTYDAQLAGPRALFVHDDGSMLIVEEFGHAVRLMDACGKTLFRKGTYGNGPGEFLYPTSIGVDHDGCFYVTDRWNHRIQKFDRVGNHIISFGSYGNGRGELSEPWGIVIMPNGDIVVADHGNGRLVEFSAEGEWKRHIGSRGTTVDYYESDRFKRGFHYQNWIHRAYKLWTIETTFFEFGYDIGELEYPEDLAIDTQGTLYVADRVGGHIALYDVKGTFIKYSDCVLPQSAEPSTVAIGADGYFVGEERGNVYWIGHDRVQRIVLKDSAMRISHIFYKENNACVYICDAWNNKIYLFNRRGV